MRGVHKQVLVGLLAVGLVGLMGGNASAANSPNNPSGSLSIITSPLAQSLIATPGGSVSTDLKVRNTGVDDEQLKISLLKFKAYGEDGSPRLISPEPSDDYIKWATFSETSFKAESNVWKTVKMTINPAKDAGFGYYYAVVFSREGAEKTIVKQKANLLGAVSTLVLLDVKAPGEVRSAKVAEFSTTKKVYEFLPTQFTVRLHNEGNVHVAPRGNIIISHGGKNVGLVEVNLNKNNILPQSFRKFSVDWADGSPSYKLVVQDGKVALDAKGKQQKTLDWNLNLGKIRIGKYNAKLVMVYDDGHRDVPIEANLSFWVIPWRILAGGLLLLLFVGAGVFTFIRAGRRRMHKGK